MRELKVNPEFRDKIPPLSTEEFARLEENILADGEVREPLVVWNNTIVDGHHRWQIIQKHPELPYKVKEMDFADKWAAIAWMCSNQLGRRNVTDEQKMYLIGKLYEAKKKTVGSQIGNTKAVKNKVTETDTLFSKREVKDGKTAAEIAKEYGIGSTTVRENANFAKGLDAADVVPGFKEQVLSGELKVKKSDIMELRNLPVNKIPEAVDAIRNPRAEPKPKKVTEDLTMTENIVQNYQNADRDFSYTVEEFKEEYKYLLANFVNSTKRMIDIRRNIVKENANDVIELLDDAVEQIRKIKEEI